MGKIIYFVEGSTPTSQEAADIAAIRAAQHVLNVSNASVPNGLGTTEECDFVAGSVPPAYSSVPAYVSGELDADQAVVTDGDVLEVEGGTVTLTVAAGVVTAAYTPEP